MPRILYKFPSRQRPTKFFSALDNITSLARHDNYLIWCSLDLDDTSMTEKSVRDKILTYDKVKVMYGTSDNKVHAINRDTEFIGDWDICIVMADDMVWHKEGFDLIIIDLFKKHFPDFDGFLHLPDGIVNERLPTMCIIGRKLYDFFGYLYYPGYKNVYCDNEQFDVVRHLNKYAYEPIHLFTHNHPVWKLAEMDDLYRRNETPLNYNIDGNTYRQRKEINFGL